MKVVAIGAFAVALAIGTGAFGAHALSDLDPRRLRYWSIACDYHFIGAFGLIVLGLLRRGQERPGAPFWLLLGGMVVFCGSLYAMALGAPSALGAITPVGGIALIAGWIGAGLVALSRREQAR